MVAGAAVYTNSFPFVADLSIVASGAGQAYLLAFPWPFRRHRLAQPDGQAVRVGSRVWRLDRHAVAVAVSIRSKQLLTAGNLQIQEDFVIEHGRALRDLIVCLSIFLRPSLLEIDHGVAGRLRGCGFDREESDHAGTGQRR